VHIRPTYHSVPKDQLIFSQLILTLRIVSQRIPQNLGGSIRQFWLGSDRRIQINFQTEFNKLRHTFVPKKNLSHASILFFLSRLSDKLEAAENLCIKCSSKLRRNGSQLDLVCV